MNYRSALAQMKPYTPGEQPPPGKFIKLNTNENPYPPAPAVVEAIRAAASGPLNRYPDPVATSFRRAAADALSLPGPEWILAGNGSDEILTILVRGFVGEGQKLRLPYPSYILYRTLADIQGAAWEQTPFVDDWKLPAAFGHSDDDLKLVLLPNPNSPSGTIVPPDEVAAIADSLTCPLVVDEAYVDFADDDCLDLVRQNENVLVTRTMSKSYGLAGVRFGFLVAQPQVIAELAKIKDSYNCDAISIAAATAAISSQDWLADVVAKMNTTRDRMASELSAMGFRVTPSHANFVWCQHSSGRHSEIYEYLKRNQILVRYMAFPDWGDGLRISVGTDDQIDACLLMIGRAIGSLG
ncbi:histidinol-phosphate transaminase [Neorhodopirellula pilleata]|uniref:Histidinol-phosphate aminotransferase n=1 Tax=Neorhodopirellula pilleata TaxID=2714738 RepID=A0A5C6ATX1_9BACT|nr:histidinol-phosphate transaminase [Neorhodopirellula pilleata]TWU03483.1 Histidinol-phosphate aminotransferase [Neorhodopirellula pilleata]